MFFYFAQKLVSTLFTAMRTQKKILLIISSTIWILLSSTPRALGQDYKTVFSGPQKTIESTNQLAGYPTTSRSLGNFAAENANPIDSKAQIISPGLSLISISSDDKRISAGAGYVLTFAPIRIFESNLYISFLFRSTQYSHRSDYSGLYLARRKSTNDGILLGSSWSTQTTSLRDLRTESSFDLQNFGGSGVFSIADNITHLALLKITKIATNTCTVISWLDPDPEAGEDNQNSPTTYTGSMSGNGGFDQICLYTGTNNPMDFAAIRQGASWNAVLPPNTDPHRFPKHNFSTWPKFVASNLIRNPVLGYSFMTSYRGKIVASDSVGIIHVASSPNKIVTSWDTRQTMHIASISKAITATAVMKLWQERPEQFTFDDPFWPFLKELFPSASPPSRKITIRQLLTHRSGLAEDAVGIQAVARILASFKNRLPGTSIHYNNLNFYLLRLWLERVSGEAYTVYVQNHVLKPAKIIDMDTKSTATDWDATAWAGAIGWHASVSDLTSFLSNLSGGNIIKPILVEKMFHESLGWNPVQSNGQIIGYHKSGSWLTNAGEGESSEIVHFLDGVDVALLISSHTRPQLPILIKAWQLQ